MSIQQLPLILTSSVIRSTHKGESHGGLYLVDLQGNSSERVIDWNDSTINWQGRGMDRGLRGIAFYKDNIIVAASNEIFIYDASFKPLSSFKNPYLLHCHEICVADDTLFMASTGYDSVLALDLPTASFKAGYCIRVDDNSGQLNCSVYNPELANGPVVGDSVHINNVFPLGDKLYVSALHISTLLEISNAGISNYAKIPSGTHNARPLGEHILVNDTEKNRVLIQDRQGKPLQSFHVPHYAPEKLLMSELPRDHARQGFARGLAVTKTGLLIGGSSPSTVSVYQPGTKQPLMSINLTMDVRNSIHGLEIWPW